MKMKKKVKSDVSLSLDSKKNSMISDRQCFHKSIKYVIAMAQFFGVMPLYNITNNMHEVTFRWVSFRVFYALLNVTGALANSIFWIVKFVRDGLVVDSTAQMAFYVCNCLTAIQLIEMARKWSKVLREWSLVEMNMRSYYHVNIRPKYIWVITFFLGFGSVEHLFFILNGIFKAKECKHYEEDPGKAFFEVSFHNYFSLVPYNIWAGILVKFSNVISTFTWIFTDLLITLISISLTARFSQIVHKLRANKIMHEKFWKDIRQDYQKLCHLARTIEKHIAFLVLVSYTHNIFFLCIQLYNSLRERTGIIEALYFFYSFGVLVLRLVIVSLFGAWLNAEAKKPLDFLHSVPTEYYCTEIGRLSEQIFTNPVGITGCGFFLVTKSFLLKMAGTIVTFELMIFQFAPIHKWNQTITYDCTN